MANNRYFLQCPACKSEYFMGKSLGDGIYNRRVDQGRVYAPGELLKQIADNSPVRIAQVNAAYAEVLEEIYAWMWEHMIGCHKDEFKGGELFKVVSEYEK